MSIAKEMDRAIVKHFEIPPDIQRQASLATWDLYYGPNVNSESSVYVGFEMACAAISDWCDDALSEVWYDIQSGEVLESEPQGHYSDDVEEDEDGEPVETAVWIEPSWEDYFHADIGDVKRALFDKELVRHI